MIIQFSSNIQNNFLQIGDTAYAVTPALAGVHYGNTTLAQLAADTPQLVGIIEAIGINTITITEPPAYQPLADDFIMFSKNNEVNSTSLLGYYAEIKLTNNSIDEAELFALSSEIAPSSK